MTLLSVPAVVRAECSPSPLPEGQHFHRPLSDAKVIFSGVVAKRDRDLVSFKIDRVWRGSLHRDTLMLLGGFDVCDDAPPPIAEVQQTLNELGPGVPTSADGELTRGTSNLDHPIGDSAYVAMIAAALLLNPLTWIQIYRMRSRPRTWRLKVARWGVSFYTISIVIPCVLILAGMAEVSGGGGFPVGFVTFLMLASIGTGVASVICGLFAPWSLRISICVGGCCAVAFWVFTRFGIL